MDINICVSFYMLLWVCLQYDNASASSNIDSQSARNVELPSSANKLNRFNFKSRSKDGHKIAVMSFRIDPERDRRSILVPNGEGLLQEIPLPQFRHSRHRFIPPISDSFSGYNGSLLSRPNNSLDSVKPTNRITRPLNYVKRFKHNRESNDINSVPRKSRKRKYKDNYKRKRNKMKRRRLKKKKKKKRISSHPKIFGQEACQYKILKSCSKKSHILPKRVARDLSDYQKCNHRQKFLYCVDKKRNKRKCHNKTRTRGNITKLRAWINEVFQTSFSCLINESMTR